MTSHELGTVAASSGQLDIIRQQLGREPRGLSGIAAAGNNGVPLVLQMQSLVDDQPFPTLFWLSSRDLYQSLAEIETAGVVKQLEQELQQDQALLDAHLADQQRYVDLRWQLMRPEDKQRIDELGFTELFNQYGIGGIRHWDKVRCLHMHYAYHLAAGSALGQLLDQRYGLDKLSVSQ